MKLKLNVILIIGSATLLLFGFQNCSKYQFSPLDTAGISGNNSGLNADNPVDAGGSNPTQVPATAAPPPNTPELGLKGGHFDLDTSSEVYAFNKGKTDHHEHEYDDKYNVKEVNFFNMLNNSFTTIASRVEPTEEFIIIVANAKLSPGVLIEINGETISAVNYQKKVDAYIAGDLSVLPSYNLASLKDFKLKFSSDTLQENILVPTDTKCVRANTPSARGEYRNGALVIQLVDKNLAKFASDYRAAAAAGGLLWEASIFWHRDSNCQ